MEILTRSTGLVKINYTFECRILMASFLFRPRRIEYQCGGVFVFGSGMKRNVYGPLVPGITKIWRVGCESTIPRESPARRLLV